MSTPAPAALSSPWPSIIASGSQSFAEPSARAMPSTITPIKIVDGCAQTCMRVSGVATGLVSVETCSAKRCSSWNFVTATSITALVMTTSTMKCTETGISSRSARAPSPAPPSVPRLNAAWNSGMIVRPPAFSAAAPDTFIDTSHRPLPNPKAIRAIQMAAKPHPSVTAIPAKTMPSARQAAAIWIPRRAPSLATMWPAKVRPPIEPTAMPRTSRPISNVLAPNESRTLGIRPSQVAMSSPDRVNTTNTAMIQALVVGTVRVDGVVMVVPSCFVAGGRGARSVRCRPLSNRFDRLFPLR